MIKYFILIVLILLLISLNSKNIEKFENKVYKVKDLVDQIYIINMDKDVNRMKNLKKKMNNLGLTYKRITGVDGKKIYKNYNTTLKPGQLGCLLSHQNILKDAIKNNYNNILVLEDDILFHKDFHNQFNLKYKYLIENEKNYDLLYLGASQKHNWKNINLNNHYYESKKLDGTFAMIINKSLFDSILKETNKLEKPIDRILYYYFQEQRKSFCFHPNIITANVAEISNTDNRKRNINKFFIKNRLKMEDFDI